MNEFIMVVNLLVCILLWREVRELNRALERRGNKSSDERH